jgi:DNA helicase TIP49 (TBP-interacting protein)
MTEDAKELLTKIGHETSLRYAIQVRPLPGCAYPLVVAWWFVA